MRKTSILIAILLVVCTSGTVLAMDFDFDDLFGGDLLVEIEEDTSAARPEEALLVQDGWDVGGRYNFSVEAGRTMRDGIDPVDTFATTLGGQIYLDARPDPNFRVLGKVGLDYTVSKVKGSTEGTQEPLKLSLQELFTDFNYDNKVFFRAGKQNVKWGVGYFFSPADVINIGRIDPQDPEAEREGPVALKVHYPRGSTNYYLYTLFDGVEEPSQVALAPKLEFVVGGTEIGLGGFYQKDKAPRAMLTLSSSLGSFAVFGEAVLSKGSDKGFVAEWPGDYPIYKQDELFLHATAGGRYSYNDPDDLFDLTVAAQYYYNGEGYANQDHIQNLRRHYALLLFLEDPQADDFVLTDLTSSGKHYFATMVNWNGILGSKFSASALLNANLSDKSGIFTASLKLPSISKISPSVGTRVFFGDDLTEYGALRSTTVFAAITLGSGSF